MASVTVQPAVQLASPDLAAEVFDFLHSYDYIHPDLDKAAFGECWKHQFFGAGPAYVLLARDAAGRLAAHYGIMPMPYVVDGHAMRAGFICQLFIAPECRKTGLFFDLERRILAESGYFGFDFVYGLVTIKPVLKAHIGLGFTRGPDFHTYAFPLAAGSGLAAHWSSLPRAAVPVLDWAATSLARSALFLRGPACGRIGIEEVDDFSRVEPDLIARVQAAWPIHADRSGAALERRLLPFGRKRYHIFAAVRGGQHLGYIVLRRTRVQHFEVTVIIDVLVAEGSVPVWNALVRHACRFGLQAGSHAVVTLARRGTAQAAILAANLFFRAPSYFTLVYALPAGLQQSRGNWPDRWHLSWFDHDFI
jgi:hypothetical protein